MILKEIIEKALTFFDAPDEEALDLDGLEAALRKAYEFLKTRSPQSPQGPQADFNFNRLPGELNDVNEGKAISQDSKKSASNSGLGGDLSEVQRDRDYYRGFIIRQIQGYMRVLQYPSSEIAGVEKMTDPTSLIELEQKVRRELDRRFQVQPLVADDVRKRTVPISVYKCINRC